MNWPREEIPDADALFLRVHRCFLQYGEIIPGVFKDHGDRNGKGGMSTDWEKYSTPVATRNRARRPEDNGVISFNAGQTIVLTASNTMVCSNARSFPQRKNSCVYSVRSHPG